METIIKPLTEKQKNKIRKYAGSTIHILNCPGTDCYCFAFDDDGKEWSGTYEKMNDPRWLYKWDYAYTTKGAFIHLDNV